ncbi:helix-turn-helix domain-containing protein [Undibacterium sp. Di24W]|uniref:helix-turn-helix domain-containing protein n=1 Tax=Undibacterium sp. Di24W TaxID=3413033 RepID=UPI003BF1098C
MAKRKLNDQTTYPSTEQMEKIAKEYEEEANDFRTQYWEPELHLGQRIQRAREAKNLTQGELSELTKQVDREGKGLSRAVISFYEANKNKPGPKEIRWLSETLSVSPSYLICGGEDTFSRFNVDSRAFGLGSTYTEYLANLVYMFDFLDMNHKIAVFDIMRDLLALKIKGFDSDRREHAVSRFILAAKQLEKEIQDKGAT